MWLNRQTEEPSVTFGEFSLKKSRLSRIGTNKQFILATHIPLGKKSQSVIRNVTISEDKLRDNSSFLNEVVNKLIENKIEVQLSKYKIGFEIQL